MTDCSRKQDSPPVIECFPHTAGPQRETSEHIILWSFNELLLVMVHVRACLCYPPLHLPGYSRSILSQPGQLRFECNGSSVGSACRRWCNSCHIREHTNAECRMNNVSWCSKTWQQTYTSTQFNWLFDGWSKTQQRRERLTRTDRERLKLSVSSAENSMSVKCGLWDWSKTGEIRSEIKNWGMQDFETESWWE
jgi:hypothetical protein